MMIDNKSNNNNNNNNNKQFVSKKGYFIFNFQFFFWLFYVRIMVHFGMLILVQAVF